jgi:hypothetical protein
MHFAYSWLGIRINLCSWWFDVCVLACGRYRQHQGDFLLGQIYYNTENPGTVQHGMTMAFYVGSLSHTCEAWKILLLVNFITFIPFFCIILFLFSVFALNNKLL